MGIKLSDVIDKPIEKLTHPKTFEKFQKLAKRAIERPKIVTESEEITKRMKERVAARKETEKIKQDIKNDKFLKKHPEFKQVFKYDTKHNKSGDAELTAKSYMNARRERFIKEVFDTFSDASEDMKKEFEKVVKSSKLDIDLLEGIEYISMNLVYKQDSDALDIDDIELNKYDTPGDNYINRLLIRFRGLKSFKEG